MKQIIWVTIGLCLMAANHVKAQIGDQELKSKVTITLKKTPDNRLANNKFTAPALKRPQQGEPGKINSKKMHPVFIPQRLSLQAYKKQISTTLLYPNQISETHYLLANKPLVNAASTFWEKRLCLYTIHNTPNLGYKYVASDENKGLSKLECGLDNTQGLSVGISGSACISLDIAGYFSNAPDLTTNPNDEMTIDTEEDINTGLLDSNVTVGLVFEIR